MQVSQTKIFGRQKKKLHTNQIAQLDEAIKSIMDNPNLGETKKGDLQGVRVYKFRIINQEYLLAYTNSENEVCLLSLGNHENFYRDLEKIV